MTKKHNNKMNGTLLNISDNSDYILDDSKMPSPEEVTNFPDTPEIDEEFRKDMDAICREFGLL